MEAQDGRVPSPRRASLPRLRRPVEDTPRVADLSALLGDIDALRLTLQTDLSLAAAALEAGAPDLACELVNGDLAAVRGFGARSAARFSLLSSADRPAVDPQPVDPQPVDDVEPVQADVVPALPRRRILSAAPLMAAAAALIGFVAFVPDRGAPTSPETTMTSAAMAGYELSRLAQAGAPDEALRLAAEELNDELAALIRQAAHDPAAAQQALMLLEATTEMLAGQGESGVFRGVLAETQLLRARLRDALPVLAQRPTRQSVRKSVTSPVAVPVVQEQPEKSREAAPSSAPKASASPKPSPKPSPASPSPTPSPEPSGSSSPEPDGDGPLPQQDDLPGF